MEMLIFSQTLFYLTVSVAIIALGIVISMVAYNVVKITRDLRKIANNMGHASEDIRESIEDALENLSSIPFLSMFLNLKRKTSRKSHRKVVDE